MMSGLPHNDAFLARTTLRVANAYSFRKLFEIGCLVGGDRAGPSSRGVFARAVARVCYAAFSTRARAASFACQSFSASFRSCQ
jgi:hypothetical protein